MGLHATLLAAAVTSGYFLSMVTCNKRANLIPILGQGGYLHDSERVGIGAFDLQLGFG